MEKPLPGTVLLVNQKHWGSPRFLAWSPDGKRIASASSVKTIQVWDAANGGHVYTYRGHSYRVVAVAWSPDGKRIASASTETIQVWQAPPIETKASSPPEKKPRSTPPSLTETISTVATVGLTILTVTASIATIVQTLIVVRERWEKTHQVRKVSPPQSFPQPGKTDIYAIRLRMTDGRERTMQQWLTEPGELKHFIDVFNQPSSQVKPTEVIFVLWNRELIVVDVTEGAQGNLQLDEMLKYLKIDPTKK